MALLIVIPVGAAVLAGVIFGLVKPKGNRHAGSESSKARKWYDDHYNG
jgi:hypothetical protein